VAHITTPGGVRFDISKFNWLGNLIPEYPVAVAWHDAKGKTFEALRNTELVVGGTGPSSVHETTARLFNALLGTKYKIVSGYKGSAELDLAMERGETQGVAYESWSGVKLRKADWLRNKQIHITLAFGLDRNPDLPDAPFALDYAKTDEDRRLMQLFFSQDAMSRPMVAPPGVPVDRLAALQRAFMALGSDAEFLADAEKSGIQIELSDHLAVRKVIEMVAGTPEPLQKRLMNVTSP
jgi:tripartite-type tricarboxylate transporter receptor subunit TctC